MSAVIDPKKNAPPCDREEMRVCQMNARQLENMNVLARLRCYLIGRLVRVDVTVSYGQPNRLYGLYGRLSGVRTVRVSDPECSTNDRCRM
jgi:hypothetical protein